MPAPLGGPAAFQLCGLWRVATAGQVLAGCTVRCELVFSFGTNELSEMLPWPVTKNHLVKSASFALWARLFVDRGPRLAAAYNTEADD